MMQKLNNLSGNDRLDSVALLAVRRIRIRLYGSDPSRPVLGWQNVRVQYRL